MDLTYLPDLLAIGGLLLLFVLLLGRTHQARVRYWVIGWLLILVHFAAEMVPEAAGAAYGLAIGVALSALLLSSVAFLWASGTTRATRLRGPVMRMLAAAPDVAICFAAALGVESIPVYALLTVVGAGVSLPLYCSWCRGSDRAAHYGRALFIGVAYGVQLALMLTGNIGPAINWLLCWHFLATAITFRLGAPRATVGVVFTTVSFVAWALVFPAGMAVGVWLPNAHISPEVWNLPKYLVATGLLVTLLEEQMAKFEHAAMHDALTNVPNRRMMIDALERAGQAAVRGQPFALVILDIDLFKEINDRIGHLAGDTLLRLIAGRLRGAMRAGDMLARIGGDEFAVLLPGVSHTAAIDAVVQKVKSALERPFKLGAVEYRVGASVGYAISPQDGVDTVALYALADQRMYDAKQRERQAPRAIGA